MLSDFVEYLFPNRKYRFNNEWLEILAMILFNIQDYLK